MSEYTVVAERVIQGRVFEVNIGPMASYDAAVRIVLNLSKQTNITNIKIEENKNEHK